MPTILFVNGYRFYFYAGDGNEPKHVHVEKGEGTGKIWLEPLTAKYFYRFKDQEKREILKLVEANIESLIEKWDEYFGK